MSCYICGSDLHNPHQCPKQEDSDVEALFEAQFPPDCRYDTALMIREGALVPARSDCPQVKNSDVDKVSVPELGM